MANPHAEEHLKTELTRLLNSVSRENPSNSPDFILAEYMLGCLEAFERGVKARDKWYGIDPRPGNAPGDRR